MRKDSVALATQRSASVIEPAQELVRRSSRGGIDDYAPVLTVLEDWLPDRALPHRRLHDDAGQLVGLLVEIAGQTPEAAHQERQAATPGPRPQRGTARRQPEPHHLQDDRDRG
ncbi:hypothetical protein [Streptomyces sp. NPDC050704]|uniref:hypothetical protein n=1 Tax=Streptomyces sp. NPDC050704 TaxID=3157219 RepID=UPI00341E436C